jgi:hypothetical protein
MTQKSPPRPFSFVDASQARHSARLYHETAGVRLHAE